MSDRVVQAWHEMFEKCDRGLRCSCCSNNAVAHVALGSRPHGVTRVRLCLSCANELQYVVARVVRWHHNEVEETP